MGFLLFIGALFLILTAFLLLRPAARDASSQVVLIKEGTTLREVAVELEARGIITSKGVFLLWARVKDYGRRIKAGEYELSAQMAPCRILEKLARGEVMTHPVTFPEGLRREEISDILAEGGLAGKEAFLALTQSPVLVRQYGLKGQSLEGFLYPDTYQFAKGLSPEKVIDVMVNRFLEVVQPLRDTIERSGIPLEKVITLASIVEKETGKAEERPLIASVLLNRLKKRMRLESDPTVIYGLTDFNGNLTRKDLHQDHPYNTYLIRGLPPGPIANPGLSAIKAVLFPAETDYLYFVSKNDGSHHFSRTLADHNRAVIMYQKTKRKKPQKTS